MIVVDPESISLGQGRQLLRTAGEFADRLNPSDRVALVEIPGPSVRVGPTQDHRRVAREVARMGGSGGPVGRVLCEQTGGRIALFEAFTIAVYRSEGRLREAIGRIFFPPDVRRVGGGDGQALEALCLEFQPMTILRDLVMIEAVRISTESDIRSRQTMRDVGSLLRSLRGSDGHKTLVWVSGGLPIDTDMSLVRRIEEEAAASRATLITVIVPEPDTDIVGADQAYSPHLRNEDRGLLERGLSAVAEVTGGDFYRARGNGRGLFERIEAQLAGHYRVAVEVGPRERVDRGRVDVAVSRPEARARVRYAGVSSSGGRDNAPAVGDSSAPARSADERLRELLRSAVFEPWLPLRVSTYTYPDGSGRARVAVTAQVGGNGVDGSDVTLAFALLDSWGTVVSSGRRRMAGTDANRREDGAYAYTLPITTAPGRYALRVAAVDGSGRAGSVEHPVRAGLALSDAPLAVGTLEVADAEVESPSAGGGPLVSSGQLAVSLDVHAESAWVFERTSVAVEVVRGGTGPILAQADASLRGRVDASRRSAVVRLPVGDLPAGSYVARVRMLRGTEEAAVIHRPFRIAG